MRNNLYVYGDRNYFTVPVELQSDKSYLEAVTKIVPKSWSLNRSSIWLCGTPKDQTLPCQGFKIHISAIDSHVYEIITKTLIKCVEHNVAFKVICRKDFIGGVMSKSCSRSSAGKLITIYPVNINIFKSIIHELYISLKENLGAYILSDKRYLDSNVVHYRYGGFISIPQIKANGDKIACIRDNLGKLVEDKREAFYHLPEWIDEPFPNKTDITTHNTLLNNRYRITEALSFSNSGGVYKAIDQKTGSQVVIKEARPFVEFQSINKGRIYSDQVLKNEYKALKELKNIEYFPEALDWFVEWEHSFLVEELISGIPLRKYRASSECTLVPFKDTLASAERFKGEFIWIGKSCINAVLAAHKRGIVIGDISPNNIMIDKEKKSVKFIDFDGAHCFGKGKVTDHVSDIPILSTPGFGIISSLLKEGSNFSSDWYALSMVLYSILLPVQNTFEFKKKIQWNLLSNIIDNCKLDQEIKNTIVNLSIGNVDDALKSILHLEKNYQPAVAESSTSPFEKLPIRNSLLSPFEVDSEVKKLASLIQSGVKISGHSNFIPIDYRAFDIYPNALAYGYYGPAVLLSRTGHAIPQHLLDKIDCIKPKDVSPGLLVGTAGMALAEIELNRLDLAEEYLQRSFDSSLFREINNFGYGLAGIGFVCLSMYNKTGFTKFLDRAIEIGKLLSERAFIKKGGIVFCEEDEENSLVGMVHGNSGIALFLLLLFKVTNDEETLNFAEKTLEYDINVGRKENGIYSWGETADSSQQLPYWEYGAGGVGAVIARFYETTKKRKYLDILKKLVLSNFSKYSAEQGSFNGLAGYGDLLLDAYQVTGDESYLQCAHQVADSIMLFSVEKEEGNIYPGRFSFRLSTDLAHGSSGIGLFLNRISTGQSRWLIDID
ncbi:class III lanthionine synthetase LanKC [Microbulbifer sp. EKSA005]|uniref:class III lanthionine synthetase LanKC n=1 Tax=Microbulbifer sp. EKSA005 TaxID=3243364 RepID=UPI004042150C